MPTNKMLINFESEKTNVRESTDDDDETLDDFNTIMKDDQQHSIHDAFQWCCRIRVYLFGALTIALAAALATPIALVHEDVMRSYTATVYFNARDDVTFASHAAFMAAQQHCNVSRTFTCDEQRELEQALASVNHTYNFMCTTMRHHQHNRTSSSSCSCIFHSWHSDENVVLGDFAVVDESKRVANVTFHLRFVADDKRNEYMLPRVPARMRVKSHHCNEANELLYDELVLYDHDAATATYMLEILSTWSQPR